MHLYLARWEQYDDTGDGGIAFRPDGFPAWVGGLLDLRPDATAPAGWCLVEVTARPPQDPPGSIYVTDVWGVVLPPGLSRQIEAALGVQRDTWRGWSLRQIVVDLVPSRPRRDGRAVIHVGSTKVKDVEAAAPRPATVTHAETWPTNGTLTSTNQDLDYTSVSGGALSNVSVSDGVAVISATTNTVRNFRAEHDTDTVDSFAEGAFVEHASNAQLWIGCRGSASEVTFYLAMHGTTSGWQLRKSVAGTRSDLTSAQAGSLPDTGRIEVDGDQVSGVLGGNSHGPVTDTSIASGTRGYIGGHRGWSLGAWSFGDLAGAAPTGTGEILGVGELEGAGAVERSGLGEILVVGQVEGTGQTDRSGTGEILGVGELEGIGEAPAVPGAGGTGEIVAVAQVEGAGAVERSGLGEILGVGELEGIGEAPAVPGAGGLGEILSIGELEGAGATSRIGTGQIVGQGELSGAGSVERAGVGQVVGVGVLEGVGDAPEVPEAGGLGEILAIGELRGTGQVTRVGLGEIVSIGQLLGVGEGSETPVPESRIIRVQPEDRTIEVAHEARTVTVREDRTIEVVG